MKKILILTCITLITLIPSVSALDIVYPRSNNVQINADSTYFLGSVNNKETLTINNEPVKIHSSGSFAYPVPLLPGENQFIIKSNNNTKIFTIDRPSKSGINSKTKENKLIEYDNIRYGIVKTEGAPIISPQSQGYITEQISTFEKGMPLSIDGEFGDFYSIILGSHSNALIRKQYVDFVPTGTSLAQLDSYDVIDTEEFYIIVFHLDKKTPYKLVDTDPFLIKIYNVIDYPQNTYSKVIPLENILPNKKMFGYMARFNGTDLIIKIRKKPKINIFKPLENMTIALDAGHGGKDTGAIGPFRDFEKTLALEFTKQLKKELEKRGANVILTRDNDSFLDLAKRVNIANQLNAVVFLSIHANSVADSSNPNSFQGTEIFYYYNQAKPLALHLQNHMESKTNNNSGVRKQDYVVIRNTNALSLLIELGYLVNPEENVKLHSSSYQKKLIKAIANGLEDFFKEN